MSAITPLLKSFKICHSNKNGKIRRMFFSKTRFVTVQEIFQIQKGNCLIVNEFLDNFGY